MLQILYFVEIRHRTILQNVISSVRIMLILLICIFMGIF